MRPQSIYYYTEKIADIADEFTDFIWTLRDDKNEMPVNFLNYINHWALESIGVILLDQRVSNFKKEVVTNESSNIKTLQLTLNTFVRLFLELRISQPMWSRWPKLRSVFSQ